MHVVVYTKPNCTYCVQAKELLKTKNIGYHEMIIGVDLRREEFMTIFPNVKSVPLILVDNVTIGGFKELKEYLEKDHIYLDPKEGVEDLITVERNSYG